MSPDGPNTLAARKDIVAIRRLQGRLIFRVATEASKKILESNNFQVREILQGAILREEQVEVVIYGVRVKSLLKDIDKEVLKVLDKAGTKIKLSLDIKKAKQLTRNSESQKYAFLVVWIRSPKVANQIIRQGIALKSDIKTVERYNIEIRIQQYYKCQDYGYNTYGYKNKQRYAYYAEDYCLAEYLNTKIEAKQRYGACNGKYKAFDVKYPKRRREKERVK